MNITSNNMKEILSLFKEIFYDFFDLIDFSETLQSFLSGKIDNESYIEYLLNWKDEFDKDKFFQELTLSAGKGKLLKIGDKWIDPYYIFSVNTEEKIDSEGIKKYRIVLNKTFNEKIKSPILNDIVYESENKEERDSELKIFRDKLGFLKLKLL